MVVRPLGLEEVSEQLKLNETDDELAFGDEVVRGVDPVWVRTHGTPSELNAKGPARTPGLVLFTD